MKAICFLFALLAITHAAFGDQLVLSRLDPKLNEAREKAFTPWCNPEQNSVYWHSLANSHIPVYNERKAGDLCREIYLPNPGLGYWVLGGLSEQALWDTQREKIKIGDELVSASVYQDENGKTAYWALWVPKKKSYLLKAKMRELGISPALVISDSAEPFSGHIVFHQKDGPVIYDLNVNDGDLSGCERKAGSDKIIARVVGGWFDLRKGRLSLLIQGEKDVDPVWRSQAQHFQINLQTREVTLEHMLFDYGKTPANSDISTACELDVLDRIEHLAQ